MMIQKHHQHRIQMLEAIRMTTGKDRDLLFEATINNGSLSIPRLVNMFFEFSLSSELGGASSSQPRDDEKSISKFFSDCRIE